MKQNITLFIFILFSMCIFAQDEQLKQKHAIDVRLEACYAIDSNQTTFGMINCEAIARDEWDKELNKYYKLLMATLQPLEKTKLKSAQLAWISYRDKELNFSGAMYYGMQGTMYHVMAAARSCDIVKQRALELKSYYEILTFDK
ncbi:MAG: DUF1311 domain-containing protein [Bacteroidia bacterium]|nr:DUF1311 domain-containing protein [Bacteroidia bacterium]